MKPFTSKTTVDGHDCTVALAGEIDLEAAPSLIELGLAKLQQPATQRLLIDLDAVTFIDSTGIGALVRLQNAANQAGKDLSLARVPDRVQRLFDITGLNTFLGIESDTDADIPPTAAGGNA